AGQAEVVRQLVIRIETLLNAAQVMTAHQYFEIDEDLTRFQQGSMLQTIPSILESRVLVGSQRLAERLKQHFFEILPYEPYVLEKINTYLQTERPQLNQADLKHDLGGLRSLQIPLWIAAATFGVFPSYTAEMIALLIKQRLLSPRQAFKLCQALEFTYDLRNFTGAARDHYFDEEARHSGCRGEDLLPNVINDNMERLYLLKKQRFQDVDDFDRYRLQMQDTIQQLSRALLRNILERHVVRTFQTFQVTVYLRQRRIIEINALEGMPQVPLSLIFSDPLKLLDLFIYIGKVGYDLSFELKDEMADLLQSLTVEVVQSRAPELSEKFSELMMTPYVDQALRIMLEISDPIGLNDPAFFGGTTTQKYLPDTLLGRFIPECNQMHFLLRNLSYHQYPVSIHSLNAVQAAEEELQILQKQYPELYQYLQPKHILALKWAVLFHDVGKIDPRTRHQISGTSIAVRALERLGYADPELFGSISLMIAHHMTVVGLSKTSAYFDQAIQQFFEIANRDLVNVILLFLVNISDYRSVSDVTAKDTRTLRTFFEETYRVYAEMRSSGQLNDAMDAINSYLDRKKQDLEFDTRVNLLIQQGLQNSIEDALYTPVAKIQPQEYERLQKGHEELEQHWRLLKMGSLDEKGLSQTTEKLIRTIRQYLSPDTINALINPYQRQLEWFFAAFPNRFLLSSSSAILAQQMMRFGNWSSEATVSVLTNPRGRPVGLLVYVQEAPQIHSRIAYALSRRQINIEGAKMNRICFADGRSAYCYYLQITVRSSAMIFPRELEHSILYDSPPQLDLDQQHFLHNPRLQLEFLEDDEKGYVVKEIDGHFVRMAQSYLRVKLTLEDAPLIFYKLANSFDCFEVSVQQSLITTTGFQVNDYFYILPQDLERLRSSGFEEVVKRSLSDPPSHN
ncbi:MAG: protein-PII uridylyltransferase, partial [Deltaproteobacteria bacterium]|nr:protein-PII uridylyltransferase [Deltaproteobacteria bacterium]